MLSRAHRLHRPADFRETVRSGARAGSETVVVHLLLSEAAASNIPPQIGFIVTKAVGPAVVRTRVKRRLRHLCRSRVHQLAPGCRVVVRALPPAASASSSHLDADLESCLHRAARRAGAAPSHDRHRAVSS
jgi:ribonuclease P protein component